MKNLRMQTDEELVGMYIAGNEQAFNVIMERYQDKVFKYIYSSVHDQEEAEDMFQEVFVKIIMYIRNGHYNESGRLNNMIMRITRNHVIDHYRTKPNVSMVSNDDDSVDVYNNPKFAITENCENELIVQQTMNEMRTLIEQLPESQRNVVMMRVYEDMSFKEIAATTNVSINTALGRMHYAMETLKRQAYRVA